MVHVPAATLRELATGILVAAGSAPGDAATVADSLVLSNLLGHDSHGVRRLGQYLREMRAGRIDPAARPKTEPTRPGALLVHGQWAFGQLAASLAVRDLLPVAAGNGTGVAAISECNHVGRLGEYVATLAEHGVVGLAFGNADPTVAPLGGRERRLGTNPLAWAVPRAEGSPPLVLDWATAGIAEGKLALTRDRDETVPPGVLLDAEGRTSTDPGAFYSGGALRPFGGHKGYGLSLLIEIVGGLLSGTGIGSMPGYEGGFGTVLVAVDIGAFVSPRWFREETERFCGEISRTPLAEGHEEVLVPGEPEQRARAQREREGIPLPQATWDELRSLPRSAPSEGTTSEETTKE